MTKKLSFAIDNAKLINENPNSNFALLSLDFFASGANKHDTYVSEDTLFRTADTIKNCPVVWKYDPMFDDIGTHDPEETPCGFIPQDTVIESKKLEDGRTMLSVLSYVWKKYSGKLLEFFKRDGDKPVSVEMSVYEVADREEDNLLELKDYKFEAVTVLGSLVNPAIPGAKGSILQFSEEYKSDFEKEFSKKETSQDMSIPKEVKEIAEKALEKYYSTGNGSGTSVSLAMAKSLTKNNKISVPKLRQIVKFFEQNFSIIEEDMDFYGGSTGARWARTLYEKIEELNYSKGIFITMPYQKISDINPALKGIEPPITLGQANQIAKQAEAIGIDEKKNGWAIAISSFKKTHKVVDGKWVKKEEMSDIQLPEENNIKKENKMAENEIIKEEMAEVKPEPATEEVAVEMAEKQEEVVEKKFEEEKVKEEKFEEEKVKEEKVEEEKEEIEEEKEEIEEEKKEETYSWSDFVDSTSLLASFEPEEGDTEEMTAQYAQAKEEIAKGMACNTGKVMAALYAKMCKMAEFAKKAEEERKAYMAENEELKKFKAEVDAQKKFAIIEQTINELSEKVVIPDEAVAEFRARAENFSIEELDGWKNECKAKSFDFALKEGKTKEEVERIGLPWNSRPKPSNDIWAAARK